MTCQVFIRPKRNQLNYIVLILLLILFIANMTLFVTLLTKFRKTNKSYKRLLAVNLPLSKLQTPDTNNKHQVHP